MLLLPCTFEKQGFTGNLTDGMAEITPCQVTDLPDGIGFKAPFFYSFHSPDRRGFGTSAPPLNLGLHWRGKGKAQPMAPGGEGNMCMCINSMVVKNLVGYNGNHIVLYL